MKIRSAIAVSLVIAGIVCTAAVVVGLALILFRHGYQYSALAVLLGSAVSAGIVWGAAEREHEAAEEFSAPEGALPQRERA